MRIGTRNAAGNLIPAQTIIGLRIFNMRYRALGAGV
jgi:hypothetical protein